MGSRRLVPTVVGAVLMLVLGGALIDPVGYFALLGTPGRWIPATRWQAVPLVVYVPLLLLGTALVTAAFGHLGRRARFATVWAGFVLAAVVAKAVMSVAATAPGPNVADVLWATSFTVPKAALYGLVPAAATLPWRTGERGGREPAHRAHWPLAVVSVAGVAVTGPWIASHWSRDLPHGLPSASPQGGAAGLAAGLLVLLLALARTQRTFARRSRGAAGAFLGGWLAAMWAGVVLGAVQVAGLVILDGPGAPLQTPAALWVRLAEGASLGIAFGWLPALLALLAARGALRRPVKRTVPAFALFAAVVLAGTAGVVAFARPRPAPAVRTPAAAGPAAARGTELSPLRVVRGKRPRIVDGAGRQVLLRGVNVNQLVDFYAPRPGVPAVLPLSEDDFAQMAALGLNVVRLGVSWSRIEPRPAQYDEGYLRQIDQAVAWAKRHGLYTVIDMHQDGWSKAPTPAGTSCPLGTSRMDGYDGAPAWATKTDGAPRCQFTGRDISPAGNRAFTNFYYDRDGVQSRLVKAWGMLAARVGADPAVAGFDPLNEPGFGEQAPLTSTLLLGRFYDRVLRAVRAAETRPHPLFVEPSIFWSGTGFDALPRGSFTSDPDIVFAPHLYAESITMDASLGLPVMTSVEHGFVLARRAARDMPVWSGEWGYWGDDGAVAGKLRRYARQEDDDRLGGAFWVWKQACGDPQNGVEPTGNGLNNLDCATGRFLPRDAVAVQEISRAYPRAAPGVLISLRSVPGGRPGEKAAGPREFALTGRASGGACDLDVWVPGEDRPVPAGSGVDRIETRRVEGGWRVTGCARGSYRLTIG
ncbi:glycoside hydrolase family 5 protein [Actinomadura sp. K4S16]|uniref:glycoside hydrolase family 5 protein n=1 Tax=Actinomadura sp. K4S16 TaxID=1316147 RepID=UPI0011EE5A1E|nr:cellulase family glycosylhydrolase [Actinomadura sp. K4S16]